VSPHRPTHTVLVPWPVRGTDREDRVVARAVATAAEPATDLVVDLEATWVRDEHPGLVDDLAAATASVDATGDATTYVGPATDDALAATRSLLAIEGGVGHYGLQQVELRRDGRVLLRHVPHHDRLTVDADAADGLVAAVETALSDAPATVLPTEPLATWEDRGVDCSVTPPSLCVGNTCHGLSRLAAVDADPADLRIDLQWHDAGDGGRLASAAGWVADRLGVGRPETLRFESTAEFAAARDALARVLDGVSVDERA